MSHKNTIEINGKVYDAKSGMLLDVKNQFVASTISQPSIDGVITTHQPKSPTLQNQNTKRVRPTTSRSAPNHRKSRAQQKSQTLMRQAVKRPQNSDVHSAASIQSFKRQRTVTAVPKNPYVQKFNHHPVKPVAKTAHIPFQQPPEKGLHHPSRTTSHKPSEPKPQEAKIVTTNHQQSKHSNSAQELFERALAAAPTDPVLKKTNKTKAKRIGKFATLMSSLVLIAGFIAYMNLAVINLQVASSQAGFTAHNPGYVVGGFTLNRVIQHEPGKVTLTYNSNSDARSYQLIQEVSGWTSASLRENFLAAQEKTYQTVQENGRTVFLFDNGKATWVNGGIWYTVDSDALSTDQLLKIASSL